MRLLSQASRFARSESGAITRDWAVQFAIVVGICTLVLASIDASDENNLTSHTHLNGYVITGEYP